MERTNVMLAWSYNVRHQECGDGLSSSDGKCVCGDMTVTSVRKVLLNTPRYTDGSNTHKQKNVIYNLNLVNTCVFEYSN